MAALSSTTTDIRLTPLIVAGVTLGIGLGGFVDGILFHQVLQWHHMLTAHEHYGELTVANLETNTLWDGLFHSATWVFTALGLAYLWRATRMEGVPLSTMALLGSLGVGWGAFNLVEGVINHHILGLHHVRDDLGGPIEWDLAFLTFGALLVLGGVALILRAATDARAELTKATTLRGERTRLERGRDRVRDR